MSLDDAGATDGRAGSVPVVAALAGPLRQQLLRIAREAIERGLAGDGPWLPALDQVPEALCAPGASFVTLYSVDPTGGDKVLRGCVGSLEAHRPLVQDVALNAFQSAFGDRRFAPVTAAELAAIEVELSLLSPLVPLRFSDEAALLRQWVVAEDGVVIEWHGHRATFLPSVWQQLPAIDDFWLQLKRKAGLAEDFWHPGLRCWRYRVLKITQAEVGE